jgi:di/tricarboxylate transporter
MSPQSLFSIILLIATLLMMASQRLRSDLVAVLVMLLLILSGVLTPVEAFSAFGQPVIIVVASILVLGAALYETGVAVIIANQILRFSNRGEVIILLAVMLIATLLTSVLGALIVVALLMPAVLHISRRTKIAPSRMLLPLATVATVGSQLTLIGTPSNVVVSDILAAAYEPLGLFDLAPYAIASVGITMAWYLLPGRRLLRQDFKSEPEPPSLDEVQQDYKLDKLLYRLRVRSISDLYATKLGECDLSTKFGLNLIAIRPKNGQLRTADSEWIIEQDDLLIVTGEYGRVLQAATHHNLEVKGTAQLSEFSGAEQRLLKLAEVIVPIRSPLVGRSLADIDFRTRYGLNILAVQRQGKAIRKNLAELVLNAGDTLLVEGPHKRVLKVGKDLSLVFMTDLGPQPGELVTGKARIALIILGLMLVSVVADLLTLATASLTAVVALTLTGCISIERAYRSINWRLIVLIGGMLPLAAALEKTGAAALIAKLILGAGQEVGVLGSLVILHVITALITQVVSNSVVAALMMPIAINLAVAQGTPVEPFAIVIAFAVMAAFVTPFTDGVNLLVREPGQYTMRDVIVNGLPIFIVQTVVIILMLAVVYGLA